MPTWLATGFLAATTVTMLLAAWCVERFGIRTAYLASMVIFLLGSVLGGSCTKTAIPFILVPPDSRGRGVGAS